MDCSSMTPCAGLLLILSLMNSGNSSPHVQYNESNDNSTELDPINKKGVGPDHDENYNHLTEKTFLLTKVRNISRSGTSNPFVDDMLLKFNPHKPTTKRP